VPERLSDGWSDWAHPTFLSGHTWDDFLARQRMRYPDLLNDLQPALQSLHGVWILKQSEGWQYHREFGVPLNRA
jgi:hypothetical protein